MKMYAYQKESGKRVHCSEVQSGEGLEISGRSVGRRVRKKRPKSNPKNFYFYFLALKGLVAIVAHGSTDTTLTHLALIDLLREVGKLRCTAYTQYGGGYVEDFRANFNRADLEKTYEEDRLLRGHDRRRPDMTCTVDEWSIYGLAPTRLFVEVGVTSIIRDYARYAALIRIGIPCLELLPPRLDDLEEAKPGELDRILREMLRSGSIEARWIVDPRLRQAAIWTIAEVRAELDKRCDIARKNVGGTSVAIRKLQRERDAISVPSEPTELQTLLNKLDEQLEAIVRRVDVVRKQLRENTSILRRVVEFVIPELQNIRYANIDEQMKSLLEDLRGDSDVRRSGLIGDINSVMSARKRVLRQISEATLEIEMAQRAAARVEADAKGKLEILDAALQRLRFLKEEGQKNILVLPCQELEDAVAAEYDRHQKNRPPTLFE